MAESKGDAAFGQLVFALNGERVELAASEVDPLMTLNDFIRTKTRFKGTKLACGEGGCGACAVTLSRWDAATGAVVYASANSCLRSLASMHGWAVTTTEGLGSSEAKQGFHPIQERMASLNATQCGFCTPGMVMACYTSLKKGNTSKASLEQCLDGNLCRCTGYRPILDAAKSFAVDTDIEDLVCKTTKIGPYDHGACDPAFPAFLKAFAPVTVEAPAAAGGAAAPRASHIFVSEQTGSVWYRPLSLEQAFAVLAERQPGTAKLVVGNTGWGIFKDDTHPAFVDLSAIGELQAVSHSEDGGLTIGAALSISAFQDVVRHCGKSYGDKAAWSTALAAHLQQVAGQHVRNVGSVGGNIMLAKTRGFQSDIATLLLGLNATVTLASRKGKHSVDFAYFLDTPDWVHGEILYSITLPATPRVGNQEWVIRSFKAALRMENSKPLVNACFALQLQHNPDDKPSVILQATLAYGGVQCGEPGTHALRARKAEAALQGKSLTKDTLSAALAAVGGEFEVKGGEMQRAGYRARLVTAFLYKYFAGLGVLPAAACSAAVASHIERPGPMNKSTQRFTFPETHKPVSQPIQKIEGKLQCSGEARFVDDMPPVAGTLFAAYVVTSQAGGQLSKVDASAALALKGVAAFITAKDVPAAGRNTGSSMGEDQPLFLAEGGSVTFAGQSVGLVLAETAKLAQRAARLVRLEFNAAAGGAQPLLTIEAAIAAKSLFDKSGIVRELGEGEKALAGDAHRLEGEVRLKSQQHFYMEPQVSFAVPDEDGSMSVHVSTQWPDSVHTGVSGALGLPQHKVKIVSRRAGGGFGGKLTHATFHACTAAVAARATGRPVRLAVPREVDSGMTGGREEVLARYSVAFNDKGRLSALKVAAWKNAGCTVDFSAFSIMAYTAAVNQVYDIANLRIEGHLARTQLPTRTVMRGPGEIEASVTIETILAAVAHKLGLPVHAVQEANFYDEKNEMNMLPNGNLLTHFTLPRIWRELKDKAHFESRLAAVARFNQESRYRKRGLAMTPVRYEVGVWPRSAVVSLYGDGSCVIAHDGSEIGQGINTKVAQMAAHMLGKLLGQGAALPLKHIAFADTHSHHLPQAGFTGGSTGSEGSCECVRRACQTLVDRLQPIADSLRKSHESAVAAGKESKEPGWEDILMKAKGAAVDLQARGHWANEKDDALSYQNFGAAVSEVEVDVLSGETTVRAADLLYDCGKSLNPAIDIGQCEGAFIQGLGYMLREDVLVGEDGRLGSANTWTYKPPCSRDVPLRFSVELLQDAPFDKGILSSKASGEPPLVLATSVLMAVRQAIAAARADAGQNDFFPLPVPATVDVIANAVGVTADKLLF